MAKYKAVVGFSGQISMYAGEVRELTDKAVIKDLTRAGYIEPVRKAGEKNDNQPGDGAEP